MKYYGYTCVSDKLALDMYHNNRNILIRGIRTSDILDGDERMVCSPMIGEFDIIRYLTEFRVYNVDDLYNLSICSDSKESKQTVENLRFSTFHPENVKLFVSDSEFYKYYGIVGVKIQHRRINDLDGFCKIASIDDIVMLYDYYGRSELFVYQNEHSNDDMKRLMKEYNYINGCLVERIPI